ncbi:MAG TPA: TlpA disulfide reductase family protein [Pirellulales bacterium]|jgi:peroxiredoxin
MVAFSSALLAVPLLICAVTGLFETGQRINYHGTVTQRVVDNSQPAPQQKSFELSWFVADTDASGTTLYWLVEERGRGAWPWPERFGQLKLDAQGRPQSARGPTLLFDYGEGESIVPLSPPQVALDKSLAKGATWSAGGEEFEVQDERTLDDRATWQIHVKNAYGAKRTMLVDKAVPMLVSTTDRVFMNKGTEYTLEMTLAGIDRQTAEETAATRATFDSMLALLGKLHRPPQSTDAEWNPEQIAILAAAGPDLEKQAAGGPLARLAAAASRDAKLQGGRADEVADLVAKFQGQPLPAMTLAGLSGGALAPSDLEGRVTVLHFWEYRDQPLKEPYGQVGYLEFLYQKRKEEGVKVYGVAVDARLNDQNERRTVVAGIRKLRSFMNLTYPLVLDSGEGIKAVGDPRLIGATLPLVLVVGRDGRIAHYHVGHYEVDRQEGLKELNAAVTAALKK